MDILSHRQYKAEDGTVIFIDPGTEKKKKNRKRHIKDGAPKSMRGIPAERRSNGAEIQSRRQSSADTEIH